MDLSKDFYCVPHDLTVYGLDGSFLCYKYSYLLNRKQYVLVKSISSDFLNVMQTLNKDIQLGRSYLIVSLMTFLRY